MSGMRRNKKAVVFFCLLICMVPCVLSACKRKERTFGESQVIRAGDQYMTKGDAAVLICGLQQKYESMFGDGSWSAEFGQSTLEQYIKEQIKNQLVQLAGMNLYAKEQNITLTDAEKKIAGRAADAFIRCFSKEQMKKAGIEQKDVEELYIQYATAEKLYEKLTADVEEEISDDEARMIDIQMIYFASTEDNNEVTQKAYQVWERATAGESFESLAAEFNDGSRFTYYVGRGELEEALEEAAFRLASGQISSLVEGKDGIYLIRCVSNYNQEETDANKESIYEKKCSEVFNKAYNKFLKKTDVELNEKAWEQVELVTDVTLPAVDFLDIYESAKNAES